MTLQGDLIRRCSTEALAARGPHDDGPTEVLTVEWIDRSGSTSPVATVVLRPIDERRLALDVFYVHERMRRTGICRRIGGLVGPVLREAGIGSVLCCALADGYQAAWAMGFRPVQDGVYNLALDTRRM